jgi:hypothetical protein
MAETKTPAPHPKTLWRSWDHSPDEDLVEMPRTLALDLVKTLSVSHFLHGSSDDDCEAGLHEKRLEAHRDRMEKVEGTIVAHLCDEGLPVNAEVILRSLVMAYETAPNIPAAV